MLAARVLMRPSVAHGEAVVFASEFPAGWDELAILAPSPFLTQAWLEAWWSARGRGERLIVSLAGDDGTLLAGAAFVRDRFGTLSAMADEHTGDWDIVAVDDHWRGILLEQLGALESAVVVLGPLRSSAPVREAFARAGRRFRELPGPQSPYLPLPGSFDELLAERSSNLRSQFRRRHRALERRGTLSLRTTTGGQALEQDLDALLRLEASGWKARKGTAILSQPDTEDLYRRFARAAAAKGWLRLYLLELDGVPIAGDLGCSIGGEAFLVKTGFDESLADASPGLVLRGKVIKECVEEGLRGYDFLGGADSYKLRWTEELRPRCTVRGYRGAASVPSEAWHHALRPALARARRRFRMLRESR